MTDKQIIIDGIDVSGCEWYSSKYFKPCGGCKNTPDCHYKNWKRKEQECEELKEARKNSRCAWKSLEGTFCPQAQEQLEAYKMEAEEGKEINAELKAENDELKKANIHIDNNRMVKADKLKRIEDLIIACSSGYTDEFIQNLLVILHEPEPCFESKLSRTLAEIKEISEKGFKHSQCNCGAKADLDLILQKISECEGNDE